MGTAFESASNGLEGSSCGGLGLRVSVFLVSWSWPQKLSASGVLRSWCEATRGMGGNIGGSGETGEALSMLFVRDIWRGGLYSELEGGGDAAASW